MSVATYVNPSKMITINILPSVQTEQEFKTLLFLAFLGKLKLHNYKLSAGDMIYVEDIVQTYVFTGDKWTLFTGA